jgi:glyoxylase-like metal-dependent hydrolase (beta-lactamase superfamily II)
MNVCTEPAQRCPYVAKNFSQRTRLDSHRAALRYVRNLVDRKNTDTRTTSEALLRSVMVSTVIALASTFTMAAPVSAAAPKVRTQAPGVYRMMLGDFEITALLDGTHPFPDVEVLTKAKPGVEAERSKLFVDHPGEANALLAASDLAVPTEGWINAFLVNTGTKIILVGSGAGTLYGACRGHLMNNLRAAGYQPEQADDVFLTHLHADYVGGISPDGKIAFPNAIIRASKLDADYWLDDANDKTAPAFLRPIFKGDKASLQPYIAAGRFLPFEGGLELVPGVRAIPTSGHMVGHTFYEVETKGQKLVVWGDVVHVAAIQFPDPAISVEYDADERPAEQTREAVIS